MKFLTRTRFDSLRSALVIAGVLMFLVAPSAEAASPTYGIGTYSGTTSQNQHFTLFVVDSACPGSNSPVRLCLYASGPRSEEHTSELQSLRHLVCRLLLEKKKIH